MFNNYNSVFITLGNKLFEGTVYYLLNFISLIQKTQHKTKKNKICIYKFKINNIKRYVRKINYTYAI